MRIRHPKRNMSARPTLPPKKTRYRVYEMVEVGGREWHIRASRYSPGEFYLVAAKRVEGLEQTRGLPNWVTIVFD